MELPESRDAASGTLAHSALAGEVEDEDLDDELEMAVGICRQKAAMLLVGIGFEDYEEMIVERRLWLHDASGNEIASGQPDRVYIQGKQFAILDFKTGRKDAPAPALNPQLITLALLIQEHYGLNDGFIGIVPAWRATPPMAQIGPEGLAEWKAAIVEAINETTDAKPRAEAGEHCAYCSYRWRCPEAWSIVESISKSDPEAIMQETPDIILQHFITAEHATKTIEAFREMLRAKLAIEPDSIPGIRIGKSSEMKTIPGSEDNYKALTDLYSPRLVLGSIKFTPAALAKSISGGKGQVLVKKQLEEELAAIIDRKPKAGSLERVA